MVDDPEQALFGEDRWYPYMEDPGTLWLLLTPKSQLPVWWLAFNEFNAVEFAEADLEAAVSTVLEAASEWAKPNEHSLNKNTSALLRTYAPADRTRRARLDDMFDCPLRELNLMGAPTMVYPCVWFGLIAGKLTLLCPSGGLGARHLPTMTHAGDPRIADLVALNEMSQRLVLPTSERDGSAGRVT